MSPWWSGVRGVVRFSRDARSIIQLDVWYKDNLRTSRDPAARDANRICVRAPIGFLSMLQILCQYLGSGP